MNFTRLPHIYTFSYRKIFLDPLRITQQNFIAQVASRNSLHSTPYTVDLDKTSKQNKATNADLQTMNHTCSLEHLTLQ